MQIDEQFMTEVGLGQMPAAEKRVRRLMILTARPRRGRWGRGWSGTSRIIAPRLRQSFRSLSASCTPSARRFWRLRLSVGNNEQRLGLDLAMMSGD